MENELGNNAHSPRERKKVLWIGRVISEIEQAIVIPANNQAEDCGRSLCCTGSQRNQEGILWSSVVLLISYREHSVIGLVWEGPRDTEKEF